MPSKVWTSSCGIGVDGFTVRASPTEEVRSVDRACALSRNSPPVAREALTSFMSERDNLCVRFDNLYVPHQTAARFLMPADSAQMPKRS